jgi:hypothetical protein
MISGNAVRDGLRRQVFGLPDVAVTVTEHHLIERGCG